MPLDVEEIEKDVAAWDGRIAVDSDAGRLDFLLEEARGEKDHADLNPL